MIAIQPITINSTNLTASNVPETDHSEWSEFLTYAVNDYVIVAAVHNIYKSVAASNINHDPQLDIQGDPLNPPVYWELIGKTNKYRMFDELTYTQTERAGSIEFSVNITDRFTALSLLNLECTEVIITVTQAIYGMVFNQTYDMLNYSAEASFYSYFFDEPSYTPELAVLELPNYANSTISVVINNPSGTAKCGACIIGKKDELGKSQYGLTVDLNSFSSLLRNFDGTYKITKRESSKQMELSFPVDTEFCAVTLKKIAQYLDTPVLFIGADDRGSTYVYGILTKGRESIVYSTESLFNLSIDGFI